ncbi:MAG: vitamin K epoxide reductase family protein [Candidatus Saccharimonadales bacterium]|jgi:uncharacterized membrane protein
MVKFRPIDKTWTLQRVLPWLLIIGGLVAMVASLLLTIEVFNRLENPHYVPICNLNPILSCTSVADSQQSHLFGFPNYFIGVGGYAVVAVMGVAILAADKLKRWFWQLLQTGLTFAIAFLTWLQFETIYRIGALCLFCIVVWAASIPMFWYTTLYNLRAGNIKTPTQLKKVVGFAQKYHLEIVALWFLIIIALIIKRFWYYWQTL